MSDDRYARQTRFGPLGNDAQVRLGAARVVLVGCGALGSAVANGLVRAGVGHLTILDRDYVELSNLQRQVLFDESHVADDLPKAIAASRVLAKVNGEVSLEPVVVDVHGGNVEDLFAGADLVIDGTDSIETRGIVNEAAVKLGISWIYGGVVGSTGMSMTVIPGETPCLRCVFPHAPAPGSLPTCQTAGVIGPAVEAVGAIQTVEAMKLLTGHRSSLHGGLVTLDMWTVKMDTVPTGAPRTGCPVCERREFPGLGTTGRQAVSLCGRDSMQVSSHPPAPVDLTALARRLDGLGDVRLTPFLLRFTPSPLGRGLTVFPDGRAIVHDTTEPSVARADYARWVGH
ncbi:MAG: Molybdopterin-synthase adenylyltransferase [uncultured Thermomicrobiales bacterium]|uniref:Molybdopterin-synthase adenylyltransferase n=1 Tax=uncultured Thermomicrobiales bacterium TaxID=1645740 RepID=A0A6J4UVA2_9BACT|nr:MAG: Molybdopterin-synthase adenylyltransferase [uncultured Thermomicrobiales bacterium]